MATAQMALQCGHHKSRLPLRILMSTSTGEQWHSGQGTATNSELFNQAFQLAPERPTCTDREQPRTGRVASPNEPPAAGRKRDRWDGREPARRRRLARVEKRRETP